MGFKLAGHDAMGSGDFEPTETRLVKQILPKVDVFVNVGANIGYYCCLALQAERQVIAFEPIAENVQHLLSNVRANNWEALIEVYPLALSDRIGVIDIYGWGTWASVIKGWAGTAERHVTQVPTNRLDNVLAARLENRRSLILVDIEGAEFLMLAGAHRILEQTCAPIWLIEISIDEHQPNGLPINPRLRETFDLFWRSGYQAWTATDDPRPVEPADVDHVVASGTNLLGTHNFLFIKSQLMSELLAH
ncbi:FkbM family methyltransferase [Salinisphaera aquimarina]